MNHRAAVPLLKAAQTAWKSESRWETYLAVLAAGGAVFLVAREVWRLKAVWSEKD